MTGQEAADLVHQRAWVGQRPGLDRIRRLLGRLGDPQEKLKFVHIAGSNGKGSTAAMAMIIIYLCLHMLRLRIPERKLIL